MRASIPALFLVLTLAACRGSEGAPDKIGTTATAAAPASRGFVVTEVKPTAGDLKTVLQAEVAKAKAQGLKPYVELSATWCDPCNAIKKSLDDPRMKAAFKGTYVVTLDVDAWGKQLAAVGLPARSIPVFYAVDDDGKPTSRKVGGDAWKEDVPANMAPPLDRFFHGS